MSVLYAGEPVDTAILVAPLVCLIPTSRRRNLLTYGGGRIIAPFVGIKLVGLASRRETRQKEKVGQNA